MVEQQAVRKVIRAAAFDDAAALLRFEAPEMADRAKLAAEIEAQNDAALKVCLAQDSVLAGECAALQPCELSVFELPIMCRATWR